MRTKHKALFSVLIGVLIASLSASAGGLNPIARGTTMATDDAWSVSNNPATAILCDETSAELGARIVFPRFYYSDAAGRKQTSDKAFYPLPTAGAIWPVGKKTTVGVTAYVPFGLGAKFENNPTQLYYHTETMISATALAPVLAFRFNDKWSGGFSGRFVQGEIKYHAPFDIKGTPVPMDTDSEGDGYGLGVAVGLLGQLTDKLTVGFCYDSEVKVDLSGHTDIYFGPMKGLKIRDGFDSAFTFPPRVGAGFAWDSKRGWGFAGDINWTGYHGTVKTMWMDFDKLPLRKPRPLNWDDCLSIHGSYWEKISDALTVETGVDYMTAAITDTVSTLTPDVPGWDAYLRLIWEKDNVKARLGAIYVWGEQTQGGWRQEKYEMEGWILEVGGEIKF